jgi:protein-L-isoaspartate(D-aspartate) O-methyltransferase
MKTLKLAFLILFLFLGSVKSESQPENMPGDSVNKTDEYFAERQKMVDLQIVRRGVNDKLVIEAMRNVPRHKFVSSALWERAYDDNPLPIGDNQTISQPYIVALMTELLKLKGGERVLEIGTGSGYQAAILAEICDSVYTIEIICNLAERAKTALKAQGYENVKVICADGYIGLEEAAPFDGIMVTAAPGHVPQPLLDQLKVGARLVIPVGDYYQYLKVYEKTKDGIKEHTDIAVRFVPMTGKAEDR